MSPLIYLFDKSVILCLQHLSINGDVEYLRTLSEKEAFKLLHPQVQIEARPLPIKIKVQQI